MLHKVFLLLTIVFIQTELSSAQNFFERGAENVGKTFEKAVKDTKTALNVAVKDLGRATGKAADDARNTLEKAMKDATVASGKAGKDVFEESKKSGDHAIDFGKALGKYAENTIRGNLESWNDAERRLREGKILDAIFHAALDPLTAQEEAVFNATQQSGWLNTIGATAAAAYGGAPGAAAYASWQTYQASGGNAEMAIRAGIITGLSNVALGEVGKMSGKEFNDMMKKSILAGAIGGVAIAASGGDEKAIKDGFIMGGGMVLIQDAYQNYTKIALDPKAATDKPYSLDDKEFNDAFFTNDKGQADVHLENLDRNRNFVGFSPDKENPIPSSSFGDNSPLMRTIGVIPNFNAMAMFHDKLVLNYGWGGVGKVVTIFPSILLTYKGTPADLNKYIVEGVLSQDKPGARGSISPGIGNPQKTTGSFSGTTFPVSGVPFPNSSENNGRPYARTDTVTENFSIEKGGRGIGAAISKPYVNLAHGTGNPYVDLPPKPTFWENPYTTPKRIYVPNVMYRNPYIDNPYRTLDRPKGQIPGGYLGEPGAFEELAPFEMGVKYVNTSAEHKDFMERSYAVLHSVAPTGSMIFVRSLENGRHIRAMVIGQVSEEDKAAGITVRFSKPVLEWLDKNKQAIWVECEYEDVSPVNLRLKAGSDLSSVLLFDNLGLGTWNLIITNMGGQKVFETGAYSNTMFPVLNRDVYRYNLNNDAQGQLGFLYQGRFTIE